MRNVFAHFLLAACVALTVPAFAADAIFSAAESTHPSGTAQAPTPVIITPPNAVFVQTNWIDSLLQVIGSTPFLAGLAYVVIRMESVLQKRTKIDLAKATGIAHSLFNTLFDLGLIKTGKFRDAEEAFFSNFDTQFFNAYGHKPDSDTADAAHAQFTQLFTQNTGDELPTPIVVKA